MALRTRRRKNIPLLLATGVIAIIAVALLSWHMLHQTTPSRTTAAAFIKYMEAGKVSKAINLSDSTDGAQYYALLAQQMGENYTLIKEQSNGNQTSYIYRTASPRRPGATYIRIIITDSGKKQRISNVIPSLNEPSQFPAK